MELKRSPKEVKELKNECIQKFLRAFPRGFTDENFLSWERDFKWKAHESWLLALNKKEFKRLITNGDYEDIARRAMSAESSTNFLLTPEKYALQRAIRDERGAQLFSKGLFQLLYGTADLGKRFELWCRAIGELPGVKVLTARPKNKEKVYSWSTLTVFPFLAQPEIHAFLKAEEVKKAAANYGYPLTFNSTVSWVGYAHYLEFCDEIKTDLKKLKPKDMIDIQSFIAVIASEEFSLR